MKALGDDAVSRRVVQLADTPIARALERQVEDALTSYLQYFAGYGLDLAGSVRIEERSDPTYQLRQQQILESLVKTYRQCKQRKRRAEVGKSIESMLADRMLIRGRGN
jgi:hypothetical protein